MDETDRRIIAELRRNAREATSNIAARLGLARSTVHERIRRMERDGPIEGYSVVLSRDPSGSRVQILILVEIRQQDTRKVLQRLESFPEIQSCLSINGDYDLALTAEAPRIEELDRLIDRIGLLPGVVRTNTFVVFGRRFDRSRAETLADTDVLPEQLAIRRVSASFLPF
ncbi:AsnC family transcriptional regulator [Rhodobacterales bacterium HKCCE3408]|nr:AsnC family transcriptional regulator [Rhodobacterales bacterium HKCCE3408]